MVRLIKRHAQNYLINWGSTKASRVAPHPYLSGATLSSLHLELAALLIILPGLTGKMSCRIYLTSRICFQRRLRRITWLQHLTTSFLRSNSPTNMAPAQLTISEQPRRMGRPTKSAWVSSRLSCSVKNPYRRQMLILTRLGPRRKSLLMRLTKFQRHKNLRSWQRNIKVPRWLSHAWLQPLHASRIVALKNLRSRRTLTTPSLITSPSLNPTQRMISSPKKRWSLTSLAKMGGQDPKPFLTSDNNK